MDERQKDLSNYRITEADDSLKVAAHCLKEGLYKDSINRSYYAAFYAVKAVLALSTVDFKRHKDVMGYFNKEYVAKEVFPREIAAPNLAGIAHTGLVVVVLPEPSGSLGRLDHVVAHHFGAQRHGHVAKALVGVGRHEVDAVVHRRIDSVHGHLDGIDILENQTFVHLVRRSGLHQVAAAGQTGAGRKAKEYVSEFFHRSLEF